MIKHPTLTAALASLFLSACSGEAPVPNSPTEPAAEILTIYSARHYDSDQTLYDAYEAQTGVTIEVREAKADQLLETLKAEGANSPADLVIVSDAGALWRFKQAGLTRGVQDNRLEALIPEPYRDADGHWFGLSRRIRLLAYDPTELSPSDIAHWGQLASPARAGEICVRSSSNIYNLSLMAEMIERIGPEAAESWARGVAANMARNPQGGDTDQLRAVAAGQCSVAIVNHYYWVRLAQSADTQDQEVARRTTLLVPEFGDGEGAHVNITGAAITASTDQVARAADFLTFLLSSEGQRLLTVETKELPLTNQTDLAEGVETLPPFTPSQVPLRVLGENQADAQRLFDLAGWN